MQVEWSLGAQLYYAKEDSHYYSLASDVSTGANSCVPPEAEPDEDASGCFHVGVLVGLCFLNLVVGATLSQLCKTKLPATTAFGVDDGGQEGIYAGGTS